MRKLVTRLLSIEPCFSPVIPSPVPFSRPLSNVLFLLSQSVPRLPSSVPCLMSLFLVSRPLFHVSRICSLSSILRSMSHFSVPCLPSSVPCLTSLFLVFRPMFHVSHLCSQSYVSVPSLLFSFPNLKSPSSLYPILLSRQFVALYWFRVCSACDEIVSEYAQCVMKLFPRMLSMRWNSFRVCSACDEIVSAYAQHAFGCPCKNCSNFNAGWAYEIIHSAYAQCVMKSFPRMLSVRQNCFHVCSACACYNFRKLLKNTKLKCKVWI